MSEKIHHRATDDDARRRATDEVMKRVSSPLEQKLEIIYEDIQSIKLQQVAHAAALEAHALEQQSIKEMLSVWNQTKGFVKTIRVMGNVSVWLSGLAVPVGAAWYFFKK